MMSIIKYEELLASFGGRTPSELASSLSQNNIKYLRDRRGRPVTTIEAINCALGLPVYASNNKHEPLEDKIEI